MQKEHCQRDKIMRRLNLSYTQHLDYSPQRQQRAAQARRRTTLAQSQELDRIRRSHTYTHDRDLDNLAESFTGPNNRSLVDNIKRIKKLEGTRGSGRRARALEALLKRRNLQ